MIIVPLIPIASQTLEIILDNQEVTLSIYQRNERLFANITVGTQAVLAGAVCVNLQAINPFKSPYFTGELFFVDTLGHEAPFYTGLGSRFELVFVSAAELAAAKG